MEDSQIIALKDVESSYTNKGKEQLYLKSINLNVTAGEILAIIGRAGAGKSALLRCIGLLDRPLTGIVSIDNKNLTFMASKELCAARRAIGYVTSKPNFLGSKNLFQNIALPLQIQNKHKDDINKLVIQALTKVGLDSKATSYPSSLSSYQIILADIARNLVNNPKILLCDDIFTLLDTKSSENLANLLRALQQELQLTIMITTNDAELIKTLCQTAIVMQQGRIVEKCSVYDLFTNPNSDIAKDFVRFATKHELPSSLRRKIVTQDSPEHHAIVRISFIDSLEPDEILGNTIDAYELKMNIIQAYQEKILDKVINFMLIEVYGANSIVQDAIKFLNSNGLQSEIIGYVTNIN